MHWSYLCTKSYCSWPDCLNNAGHSPSCACGVFLCVHDLRIDDTGLCVGVSNWRALLCLGWKGQLICCVTRGMEGGSEGGRDGEGRGGERRGADGRGGERRGGKGGKGWREGGRGGEGGRRGMTAIIL